MRLRVMWMFLDMEVSVRNKDLIVEREKTSVVTEVEFDIEACRFLS